MAKSAIDFKAAQESRLERADFDFVDLAPVSPWLEDHYGIKRLIDGWRDGVADLRRFLRENPTSVAACSAAVRVIKQPEYHRAERGVVPVTPQG